MQSQPSGIAYVVTMREMIIPLRSIRLRLLAALSVIVLALVPGVCPAGVIDNFPGTAFLSALGEPFSPYFAQTFKALPGVATDLAIELAGNLGPDDVDFHVLLTEVSGSGLTFHPTVVLFESDTVTFSSAAPRTVVHIPLPNLALVPGKTYAFILDAFVTRDGSDGTARVATNGTYADGGFYFNQGFAGSSRADHFADQWFFAESIYPPDFHDIAFQLSFAEPVRRVAFVTRQDSAEVVIVDLSNGTILGTIATLDTSPFEIALSPDASRLYVTHAGQGEDAVNILDVPSASPLQRIPVGSVPIEIALLPNGSKLYTADFFGGTVSVVDTATRTRVATIPTGFLTYDVAASSDGTRVYATALGATDLFVIDTSRDAVVDRIPIGRDFLGHVAITPDGRKAYVTEFRGQVNVIDLALRRVITTIPFPAGGANPNNGALDIAIDPQGSFAYALGFDTVNVIDLSTDRLVATIPIGVQLSDVAIDSSGSLVYVTTLHQTVDLVRFNEIVKINANSFTIQDRFVIGGLLVGLAVPPTLNQPPVADAGPDQTASADSGCLAPVSLNGSASSDPDRDTLTFTWTGSFGTATGPTPMVSLPLGTHIITLMVDDGKGGTVSDTVVVTVVDTTPPSIGTVTANPSVLWPPDHLMTPVTVTVGVSDLCDAAPACQIFAISSNEPIKGLGDGDTAPDWVITGNLTVSLRAERSGTGSGRVYTIMVRCTDASGNSSTKSVAVTVPRDQNF